MVSIVIKLIGGLCLIAVVAAFALSGNTDTHNSVYSDQDAVIQLPTLFTIQPDLVSNPNDNLGYCLTVKNRDVECYTVGGRFLGVGDVLTYYNGDNTSIYVMDKAPVRYRRILINAFLGVWTN